GGTNLPVPRILWIQARRCFMFCDRCGTSVPQTARFCPTCGKSFVPTPQAPQVPVNRVARHVRNVGILWIVYSCIHLIPGLIVGSMPNWFPGWAPYDHGWFFPHGIFRVVGGFLMIKGVIGIIAGWGLLDRQSWARMLAIVLGFLS